MNPGFVGVRRTHASRSLTLWVHTDQKSHLAHVRSCPAIIPAPFLDIFGYFCSCECVLRMLGCNRMRRRQILRRFTPVGGAPCACAKLTCCSMIENVSARCVYKTTAKYTLTRAKLSKNIEKRSRVAHGARVVTCLTGKITGCTHKVSDRLACVRRTPTNPGFT